MDYLKYNFLAPYKNSEFASQFIGLSNNSNETECKLYGFRFQGFYSKYRRDGIIHFHYKGHRVLQLRRWNGKDEVGMRMSYSFDFYSGFFTFPELEPFMDKFRSQCGYAGKISRLDIACDVNFSVQEFFDAGFETKFKALTKYKENIKTGAAETTYFGSPSITNKRHLIRVYDKLLDSTKKKKFALYKDYFSYAHVTRIEAEIRSVTCTDLRLNNENIFDPEFLRSVFSTLCQNSASTNLHGLKGLDLESSHIRKLSKNKESKIMTQDARCKRVVGMAFNLHKDGYENIFVHIMDGLRERGAYQNQEELLLLKETINNYEAK